LFLKVQLLNSKKILKIDTKILVETSEIFPEDGVRNFGRKPQYKTSSIDGVSIHFFLV